MFPYTGCPITAHTLASRYGEELRSEAEAYRLAREAKEQRRSARVPGTRGSRHGFTWWLGHPGAASRALLFH
jgi:hypothetical protein